MWLAACGVVSLVSVLDKIYYVPVDCYYIIFAWVVFITFWDVAFSYCIVGSVF